MELRDLYQEVIVDHNRNPRNFRRIGTATRELEGFNPLCGDRLTVYLELDGDTITDLSFEGTGCAISVASASLMTETLKGRSLDEAEALFTSVHDSLTGKPADDLPGKLAVLGGVRDYPTRVKCATLCWHTLSALLKGEEEPVTTE